MIKISILIVLLPHLVYTIVRGTTGIIQERNINSNNNNNNNNNDECGITSYYTDSTNSLIPNGEYALPGQWPWVAALSFSTRNNRLACGGSILTNRHILTEATCLNWNKTSDIDPNILKVALGQFKLLGTNTIVGTVNRNVASYRIHPNSDLAILILETPVEFSPFIRPICLWSGSTNLENVVDRTGYVVGWAKELYKYKNKQIVIHRIMVSEPRMLRIPIRSQETCLWNHQSLGFSRWSRHNHTLERNFCAGLLGESGPCFGDYGSGLVLFNNSTGRYHLRGVLSTVSVRKYTSDDFGGCDFRSNRNVRFIELGHIVHQPHTQNILHRKYTRYRAVNPSTDLLNHSKHSKPTIATTSDEIAENISYPVLGNSSQEHNTNSNENNNDECGITSYYTESTNSLISNGEETLPGQWPWVAGLFIDRNVYTFRCIGSILTDTHILTAALCLKLTNTNNDTIDHNILEVVLGQFGIYLPIRSMTTVKRQDISWDGA